MSSLDQVLAGKSFLLFDGGMGTMIHARNLQSTVPEMLSIDQPEEITAIHNAYVEAGCNVVTTNTFGASARKLKVGGVTQSVKEIVTAGIACARASKASLVAFDIGPIGELLEPMGSLSFDTAYEMFAEQVKAAVDHDIDLIIIETMTDPLEAKAALLAAKEHGKGLPVFSTMSFDASGRTFIGTPVELGVSLLSALGADAVGVNCSVGPDELLEIVKRALPYTTIPFVAQANAGLPQVIDGVTTYPLSPEDYAAGVSRLISAGVGIVGGCCGTTPSNIALLRKLVDSLDAPTDRTPKNCCLVSGGRKYIELPLQDKVADSASVSSLEIGGIASYEDDAESVDVAELSSDLADGDFDYFVDAALDALDDEVDVFCINLDIPDIDETICAQLVKEVQTVASLPLQFIGSDLALLESALRHYNGLPLMRYTGSENAQAAVIADKYGAVLV